ncbi:hypothetical protein V0M98_33245 (plasmid) [Pseudomonas silesiensis]|uniref:hypothetical protein n=1 Tax=Pseudomonas silesiensis TaxID=1853130 RepID=UPI0030CCA2D7
MWANQLKHDKFEKLIQAYMADPQNNHVFARKGPVVRVEIHEQLGGRLGWSVDFYCEKDPERSFDLAITPEDLLAWMWENSAKAPSHG